MIWKRQNSVRNNFICCKRYKAPPVLEKCCNFAADFELNIYGVPDER